MFTLYMVSPAVVKDRRQVCANRCANCAGYRIRSYFCVSVNGSNCKTVQIYTTSRQGTGQLPWSRSMGIAVGHRDRQRRSTHSLYSVSVYSGRVIGRHSRRVGLAFHCLIDTLRGNNMQRGCCPTLLPHRVQRMSYAGKFRNHRHHSI